MKNRHNAKGVDNSPGASRLVYSDDPTAYCNNCAELKSNCKCTPIQQKLDPGTTVVRVGRQTKERKGGGVTIISGLPLPPQELKELAQQLKKKCGCGGTFKDGIIEIQGDQRELLVELLQKQGWDAKKAGG
ncbi:MAG: stress response translation initiation inhibitor YciH [Desulfuromonadaceae bacterium]|nr:stress response translation initiation inhibitor YciH [Desulfuromonas sp.]MDY0186019.1 stress response translation initiation inhibitor YciH [Desulfuromonadaceae bacterium]